MKRILTIVFVAMIVFVSPAHAEKIALQASADTYVKYSTPSDNYGNEYIFTVGHYGDELAALIRFDLSSLPSSATINSATMNLRWTGGSYATSDMGFSDLNGTWGPP